MYVHQQKSGENGTRKSENRIRDKEIIDEGGLHGQE